MIVIATGVRPRKPDIPGIEHPMVMDYMQALTGASVGKRVAVIGAGGIGFDVCEFLTQSVPTHASAIDGGCKNGASIQTIGLVPV